MNFTEINTEIKNEELTLKPISSNDRDFINDLFQDRDISIITSFQKKHGRITENSLTIG